LSPRVEVGVSALKLKKRRFREDNAPVVVAPVVCEVKLEGDVDPAAVVAAFKVSKDYATVIINSRYS
jgi:hypothetical protein